MNNTVDHEKRLGYIYTAYRVILTLILSLLFVLTFNNPIIGGENPLLYAAGMIGYFIYSIIAYIFLRLEYVSSSWQLFFGLLVDVAALTFMLHANGGPSIQLSMLYLVVVVAAYIVTTPKKAMFVTLFAIICVVYQQFFYALTNQMNSRGFSSVLLLSISFAGTAVLSYMATRQLKETQRIATLQAEQMQRLHAMNQRIIETIQNGVMVIDENQKITLCNKAAQKILGLSYARPDRRLASIDDVMANEIETAIQSGKKEVLFTPAHSKIKEALAITLNKLERNSTLLIIERISRSQQQAQQMKLASLGRLTASIAHEIRNPIGAISQASQLLAEEGNDDHTDENVPLYRIIHKQTQRVNQIIEDVLQLSRNTTGDQLEEIDLSVFVPQFVQEYFPDKPIGCHITPRLKLIFNMSQLEQILVNLITNALVYGSDSESNELVQLIGSHDDDQVMLDVVDKGDGISIEDQKKLFEPFFTTSKTGTGLGLYLSKAFCEANGASLSYIPSQKGSCFRIAKKV